MVCFFIFIFSPQPLGGALPASTPRDDMVGVFQGIQQCSSRRAGLHFASSKKAARLPGKLKAQPAYPFTFSRGI